MQVRELKFSLKVHHCRVSTVINIPHSNEPWSRIEERSGDSCIWLSRICAVWNQTSNINEPIDSKQQQDQNWSYNIKHTLTHLSWNFRTIFRERVGEWSKGSSSPSTNACRRFDQKMNAQLMHTFEGWRRAYKLPVYSLYVFSLQQQQQPCVFRTRYSANMILNLRITCIYFIVAK